MSSDEDYIFDGTEDRDSGNESPDHDNVDEDEEDFGMDIGLGNKSLRIWYSFGPGGYYKIEMN